MSGELTGMVPRPGPEPGPYAGDVYPVPPAAPPGAEIDVFLTVGVRTSQGPGPGRKRLPAAEANALINMKYAVYGSAPPRGFTGEPESAVRTFR